MLILYKYRTEKQGSKRAVAGQSVGLIREQSLGLIRGQSLGLIAGQSLGLQEVEVTSLPAKGSEMASALILSPRSSERPIVCFMRVFPKLNTAGAEIKYLKTPLAECALAECALAE